MNLLTFVVGEQGNDQSYFKDDYVILNPRKRSIKFLIYQCCSIFFSFAYDYNPLRSGMNADLLPLLYNSSNHIIAHLWVRHHFFGQIAQIFGGRFILELCIGMGSLIQVSIPHITLGLTCPQEQTSLAIMKMYSYSNSSMRLHPFSFSLLQPHSRKILEIFLVSYIENFGWNTKLGCKKQVNSKCIHVCFIKV